MIQVERLWWYSAHHILSTAVAILAEAQSLDKRRASTSFFRLEGRERTKTVSRNAFIEMSVFLSASLGASRELSCALELIR